MQFLDERTFLVDSVECKETQQRLKRRIYNDKNFEIYKQTIETACFSYGRC